MLFFLSNEVILLTHFLTTVSLIICGREEQQLRESGGKMLQVVDMMKEVITTIKVSFVRGNILVRKVL